MKIVIIGSGNVATHLASALHDRGNQILQVFSRTYMNALALAESVEAEPIDSLNRVSDTADLYLFSIKDDALASVIQEMPHSKGIWVHTAGSISMDVFSERVNEFGVLYPLQTFSRDRKMHFNDIPLFIEASSESTLHILNTIAASLSGTVLHLPSQKRSLLHLAAVFACNFTNHMYKLAEEIIGEEDIPFDVLKPLIIETARKVMEMDPADAQTGPAVRYDEKVMQKHVDRLNTPQLKEIYKLLSESIHSHASRTV